MKLSALAALLLSGCAVNPPVDTMVQYQTCDGHSVKVMRLVVTDTNTPLLDCFKHAGGSGKAKFILLTLLGLPPAACALRDETGDYGEIYAKLSGPMAAAISASTLHSTEGLFEHELEHETGMVHPFLMAFGEECKP